MLSSFETTHIFTDYLLPIPTYGQLRLVESFVSMYQLTYEEAYKGVGLSKLNDLLYTHQNHDATLTLEEGGTSPLVDPYGTPQAIISSMSIIL